MQNNTFSNCCLCVYVEVQGLTVPILGSKGLLEARGLKLQSLKGLHSRGLKDGHTC